ncbi:major facilitator superfamily domain-containing protein [Mycotypha africana]|uniref:major facilitator superfamily domain-containing protein n=1 Tax=Mycotypha africana TaxID=64632 RepID=UPI002301C374|nr:major facilitator superfamily domain-containing protein [Mycotypha africana]KAI8970481.1 major facilitator superfamily domain-containing protein [Mycotypha africana]
MTYLNSLMLLKIPVTKDPRLLPVWRKRVLLGLVCFIAIIPGFCSTIYLPALEEVTAQLNSPSIMVTLSNSLYMLFMGIAPIFYSSISDHWKVRRPVYFFSIIIYTVGSLVACFVHDIEALLGMRILQAVGISAAWAIGAGTVADIYEVHERGNALGIYFTGSFAGPLFGPLFGGYLVERWGWRSVFWLLFVIGCILLLLVFFAMEETYRQESIWGKECKIVMHSLTDSTPDYPLQSAVEKRSATPIITDTAEDMSSSGTLLVEEKTIVESEIMNPLSALALLRHPFVLIFSMATGFAFGGMFAIENMLPTLYTNTYGFSSGSIGLSFLSPGIGEVLGSLFSGRISDVFLNRAKSKRDGVALPEDRLAPNVWPAAFFLNPLTFFLWGWPVQFGWNVWVSVIMFGLQCFAMVQIFNPCMAYLVDAVTDRGASVTAAANLVRMIWACVLSLIANPMTEAVGPGWVTFFFGMLNLVWAFLILLMKIKGPKIRAYSGY